MSLSLLDAPSSVRLFDTVLLLVNDGTRLFLEVTPGASAKLRKQTFPSSELVGASYGAVFELRGKHQSPHIAVAPDGRLLPLPDVTVGSGSDNRTLTNDSAAQSLTAGAIAELKGEGQNGTAIISALMEGSSTFSTKTAFSQEKWLKRKTIKYLPRFRVVRTTPLNVAETALLKHAEKIMGLRFDTLAQMLMQGDVRSGAVPLVFDEVGGMLLGAIAHRMGGAGTVIAAHANGGVPNMGYVTKFNLARRRDSTTTGNSNAAAAAAAAAAEVAGSDAEPAAVSASSASAAVSSVDSLPSVTPPAPAAATARAGMHSSTDNGPSLSQQWSEPTLRVVGVPYVTLAEWARDAPSIVNDLLRASPAAAGTVSTHCSTSMELTSAADDGALYPNDEEEDDAEGDAGDDSFDAPVNGVPPSSSHGGGAISGDTVGSSSDGGGSSSDPRADAAIPAVAAAASARGGGLPSSAPFSRKRPRGASAAERPARTPNPHVIRPFRATPAQAQALLLSGADSCLIAVRGDPQPALLAAARFLKPGAPFVAFCPEASPLSAAATALRGAGLIINVSLSETWTREYQVLPQRTHPTMSMHGASGFVLAGVIAGHKYSAVQARVQPPW